MLEGMTFWWTFRELKTVSCGQLVVVFNSTLAMLSLFLRSSGTTHLVQHTPQVVHSQLLTEHTEGHFKVPLVFLTNIPGHQG